MWWIKQPSKEWKPYVEKRVTKIRKLFESSLWRYVRSNVNPADIATRKNDVVELSELKLWSEGPEFLRQPEETWEVVAVDKVEPEGASAERKKGKVFCIVS